MRSRRCFGGTAPSYSSAASWVIVLAPSCPSTGRMWRARTAGGDLSGTDTLLPTQTLRRLYLSPGCA
eukprot:10884343-Alexandrium_andersonii.AAC.1